MAIIKELTFNAHFENAKRARIVVLTENAKEKCAEALLRWGRLSPTWVDESLNDLSFDEACDAWSSRRARPLPEYQVDDEKAVEYAANVRFCKFSEVAMSLNETDCLVRLATEANVRPVVLYCYDTVSRGPRGTRASSESTEIFRASIMPTGAIGKDCRQFEAIKASKWRFVLIHNRCFAD